MTEKPKSLYNLADAVYTETMGWLLASGDGGGFARAVNHRKALWAVVDAVAADVQEQMEDA